jgi:hypothetical protein
MDREKGHSRLDPVRQISPGGSDRTDIIWKRRQVRSGSREFFVLALNSDETGALVSDAIWAGMIPNARVWISLTRSDPLPETGCMIGVN